MTKVEEHDKYFDDAFTVFHDYFTSREKFSIQCNNIESLEEQRNFLRLASTYRALVKDGKFLVRHDMLVAPYCTNYFDTTYKYIALISIIEAIYLKKEHLEFFQWLNRCNKFPIEGKKDLQQLYEEYKLEYGATKKFRSFFEDNLAQEEKTFLQDHVQFSDQEGEIKITSIKTEADLQKIIQLNGKEDENKVDSIKKIATLLYDIRSNFVHKSELSLYFHNPVLDLTNKKKIHDKKKIHCIDLKWDQLLRIFERAFLRHYKIEWDREISIR